MDDSRILDFVERWDAARRSGTPITIDDLCKDCPELRELVAEQIESLKSMAWLSRSGTGNALAEAPLPISPNSNLGRYRLEALVGRGGYGEVWKAYDPQLQRSVAVKVPRADRRNEPLQVERFFEEARKVAKLKHPGLVPVFDVGTDGEWCFIVSEYVDGKNLAEHVEQSSLTHEAATILVAQVADALDYAHSEGFVHRDVKPHNILIDQHGNPHLTDFGIALLEGQSVQERSATAGTLPYMSPEQAEGRMDKINARSDIYALGVVFYELLTGRQPFVANNPMDLWASIVSSSPRPPRTVDASIPIALERICLKALSKQQEERYSTAGDLAIELRKAISLAPRRRGWMPWIILAVFVFATAVLVALVVRAYRQSWEQVKQLTDHSQSLASDVSKELKAPMQEADRDLKRTTTALPETVSGTGKRRATADAFVLGKIAVNSGDQETAIREFTAALVADPDRPEAWHGRGTAHFNRGEFTDAESDLRKAVELKPMSSEFRTHLAYALAKLNRQDESVAEILLALDCAKPDEVQKVKREVARIYDARAVKHQSMNKHAAALADLEEAVRHAPDFADAIHDLGCAYFNVRRFDEAVQNLNRAIELDPTKPEYFLHRGHSLRRVGKEQEGQADYETARRLGEATKEPSLP